MKLKHWLLTFTFGALALLIFLTWRDIIEAFYRLQTLNIWALLAMLPLLFLFYVTLSKFFSSFLAVFDAKVKIKTIFASILELNFVNHVFPSGGISGFSYLTMRLKPYGISTAKSTFAQMGRFGFALAGQIGLMFVSLFLLAIEGRASSLIILLVSILVFALIAVAVVGLFVISREGRIISFTHSLAKFANRLIHIFRRKHPETINLKKIEVTLTELHADYANVRQNLVKMRTAFIWITLSTILEVALLYAVFVAHGAWVNPGAVVIAFVIANTAGLVAAVPGGIGVFEAIMTTVFIAVGIPPGLAVSVTLVYRVIMLVLNLATGAALYHRAINKFGSNNGTTSIHG
jgi:putative heme transporter